MDFKNKLLEHYEKMQLNEVQRLSPLRRFVILIGRDPSKMDQHQLDKISTSSRYKQWKILRRLKRQADEMQVKEDELLEYRRAPVSGTQIVNTPHLDTGQWHKHQVHVGRGKRKYYIKRALIHGLSQGKDVHQSPSYAPTKSLGPRGYLAQGKGKSILVPQTGKRHKTFREEEIIEMNVEREPETDPKQTRNTSAVSPKTQKILNRSKEIKLGKGDTVIINPVLDNNDDDNSGNDD